MKPIQKIISVSSLWILSGLLLLSPLVLPITVNAQAPKPATSSATVPGATTAPAYNEQGTNGFVPCGNEANNPCTITELFRAFVVIINYLITMAGFVAVVAIVYAGFTMIYSQGQEALKAAKSRFSGAIIGLVLVAAAFVIINSLFTGKLSVGVNCGNFVLTDPKGYINGCQ